MAGPKGVSGNPAGRTPGSKNRRTQMALAEVEALIKKQDTPLAFLLEVQNTPRIPLAYRLDAAKAAAPYIHKRMPQAVEVSGGMELAHKGGVMIVPATETVGDWAAKSAKAQAELKEEVKK